MNLWFRLIRLLITARRRPALAMPDGVSVLRFRVWPHDLDPSLHMNNSRYLAIMDLGRIDIIIRAGLWRAAVNHGWTPMLTAALVRYRRELRPFTRYRLETRILAWDELVVVMEQAFLFDGGTLNGQVAARALVKGGLYDRAQRQYVPIARLMSEIGASGESPQPTAEIEAFLKADEASRRATAERG